jgi:hypothetical protein
MGSTDDGKAQKGSNSLGTTMVKVLGCMAVGGIIREQQRFTAVQHHPSAL